MKKINEILLSLLKYKIVDNNQQNLSKIEGGSAINSVPDYAEMYLDIRRICKDTQEKIIKTIEIDDSLNVEVILDGPTFSANINNQYIQKYIDIAEKVLGKEIIIKGCTSTSDTIYFSQKNIPTIIMNPIGGNPHGPNGYINKAILETLYKIYLNFINID